MIVRNLLRRAYRLIDQMILARLPEPKQRAILTGALACARWIQPAGRWPTSPDALLARRALQAPPKALRSLPDWVLNDLRDISSTVDPLLSPAVVLDAHPKAFLTPVHWTQAGKIYQRILQQIGTQRYDTVILVPWLKRGGADLGALHHARACYEGFGQRTLVISTEIADSPWAHRLGGAIPFIELGSELASLSSANNEPEIVLARLLVQLQPKRIHIINSQLAWNAIEMYGKAISQRTHIFASLYCDEISTEGHRDGLAQRYLPSCWCWLDAVITDNTASPKDWTSTLGINPSLFRVVHFPAPNVEPVANERYLGSGRDHLLWASRLEHQKRPALLVDLATAMPDFHWDIYGAALSDDNPHLAALRALENVTVHGSYENFLKLVQPRHLAFVYTSSWDGLPNVLLEATAAGIPVIAPDVGGISDLIPPELLVPMTAGVSDYAEAIRCLRQPEKLAASLAAQQTNLSDFTWNQFVSALKKVPHYAA